MVVKLYEPMKLEVVKTAPSVKLTVSMLALAKP